MPASSTRALGAALLLTAAALAAAAFALIAVTADASRPATVKEARAIRAVALRSLHAPGWRVTRIRVSTARTVARYARADVRRPATGARSVMLLSTVRGHWTRRYLGTELLCSGIAPQAVGTDLFGCPVVRVVPARVAPGGALTVTGRGWPAGVDVQLLVGPPRTEADEAGTARTTRGGRFTSVLPIDPRMRPGRYVVLACLNACRTKAAATFAVTAP